VLERLERIATLERERAPARAVLAEVRSLLVEAEAWLAVEPGRTGAAERAVEGTREALDRAAAHALPR